MSAPENPHAYPSVEDRPNYEMPTHHFGMELRDWFAGQIAASVVAAPANSIAAFLYHSRNPPKDVATWSYLVADAMLAARES